MVVFRVANALPALGALMNLLSTQSALNLLVILVGGHLLLAVAKLSLRPAHAASQVDCRITGFDTHKPMPIKIQEVDWSVKPMPVKISDIDTKEKLMVDMGYFWNSSSIQDSLRVRVVSWDEEKSIPVTVKD